MMHHIMIAYVPTNKDIWHADLGTSSHIAFHGECLIKMKEMDGSRYVEIQDGTTYSILCVEDVPLNL